jgi:hypothetical protein
VDDPSKDGKAILRSCNRPWGLMLYVEEEGEEKKSSNFKFCGKFPWHHLFN